MNILTISNFYPPHHIGGYGMLCLEVVNELMARGHRVNVLAGMHGVNGPVVEGHIHRLLTLESDLYYYRPQSAFDYPKVKQRNLASLRQLGEAEQPDMIFIWGMWALTKELAGEAERLWPGKVVYYLANPWPVDPNLHQSYWDMPATSPLRQITKRLMRLPARLWLNAEWKPFNLQYEHVLCCSAAMRDQMLASKVPFQQAPVVYEGIDLAPYLAQSTRRRARQQVPRPASFPQVAPPQISISAAVHTNTMANGHTHDYGNGYSNGHKTDYAGNAFDSSDQQILPQSKLALLFVGTLAEHKGVHTTIEALGKLTPVQRQQVTLTILGSGHPHYEARLRKLAASEQVEDSVVFHTPIPRSELPDFLGEYDVLLLPSIWEEPLARIMQEGLASGLVVVGAATGGTAEIIRDGENGLLFPAANADALTAKIQSLLTDPALLTRLAAAGQQTASEKFALSRMVDDIEAYLVGLHETTLSN
jgi:glycosyltransferase involved in cell wall biosynthesis